VENSAENEANEIETWNYRVMRKKYEDEYTYEIYEVYYNEEGKALLSTEKPIAPLGMDFDELIEDLQMMANALGKPVLDYETREEIK
jgi:hypothetical protein